MKNNRNHPKPAPWICSSVLLFTVVFITGCATTNPELPDEPSQIPQAEDTTASNAPASSASTTTPDLDLLWQQTRHGMTAATLTEAESQTLLAGSEARYKAAGDTAVARATLFADQVKASLVDPKHHGGWPTNSFLLGDVASEREIFAILSQRTQDPAALYAAIIAGVTSIRNVSSTMAALKSIDPILAAYAVQEYPRWETVESDALKSRAETKALLDALE